MRCPYVDITMLHYFILVVITLIDGHKAGHHNTSNLDRGRSQEGKQELVIISTRVYREVISWDDKKQQLYFNEYLPQVLLTSKDVGTINIIQLHNMLLCIQKQSLCTLDPHPIIFRGKYTVCVQSISILLQYAYVMTFTEN